jgi:hypothetical protein
MSKDLFDRLINHAKSEGDVILNADKPRFIKRLDNNDADLMAKAEASALVVTRQIKLVQIKWKEETFFSFFGLSSNDDFPSGLWKIDLTPGTFALSVIESNTHPIADAYQIQDAIEEPETEGFELEDISELFPPANIYQVSEPHEFHQSKDRLLGSMLSKTYLDGPILLATDTMKLLSDIFESGSKFIPYRNLMQGLLAISWENLFLETYRCIEQMYSAPSVKKLRDNIGSNLALYDLASRLDEHLSWRPKEEVALGKVIASCDEATISSAYQALNPREQDEPEKVYIVTAQKIYKLRNSIVHYRPDPDPITKSNKEWNKIICAMLEIVRQIYDRLGQDFFEGTADDIPTPEPLPQPAPCEKDENITGTPNKPTKVSFKLLLPWTWGKS